MERALADRGSAVRGSRRSPCPPRSGRSAGPPLLRLMSLDREIDRPVGSASFAHPPRSAL